MPRRARVVLVLAALFASAGMLFKFIVVVLWFSKLDERKRTLHPFERAQRQIAACLARFTVTRGFPALCTTFGCFLDSFAIGSHGSLCLSSARPSLR